MASKMNKNQAPDFTNITGRVSTRSHSSKTKLSVLLEGVKVGKNKLLGGNQNQPPGTKKPALLTMNKRKANVLSPQKAVADKRSAFMDLTNVDKDEGKKGKKPSAAPAKPKEVQFIVTKTKKRGSHHVDIQISIPAPAPPKATTSSESQFDCIQNVTKSGKFNSKFRRSLDAPEVLSDVDNSSSLYRTCVEVVSLSSDDDCSTTNCELQSREKNKAGTSQQALPEGVIDIDFENGNDPNQASEYAMDIFKYMKSLEGQFKFVDYMTQQPMITKWMRSLLIDWLVEVQESFELNHETLYLAVKIIDMYLGQTIVGKEVLQLLGTAALLIASKYDERLPPLIDDFLYISEYAFKREDVINMERGVFKVVEFKLAMPLSYRFLRRFARCCKATMPTLTLARYILELSLMEYEFAFLSDSKTASAALYLALCMKKISGWTPTLVYYSTYEYKDFRPIVLALNTMLHQTPKKALQTIRNKYSHRIFFEVAKTPLIDNKDLDFGN